MKTLILLVLIVSSLCVCFARNNFRITQPASPTFSDRFVSKEGLFSIWMPETPKESTSTVKLAGGNYQKHDYIVLTKDRRYAVSYLDLNSPITKEKDLKSLLQDSCGKLNISHHKLVGAAFIDFANSNGIQCTLDSGHGVEVMQVLLVAQRIYMLSAITLIGHTPSTDSMVFLHSFELRAGDNISHGAGGIGSSPNHTQPVEEEKNRPDESVLSVGDLGSIDVNDKLDARLIVLNLPRPDYTTFARDNKVVGTVVVEALFTAEGHVRNVQIYRPLGYGLDEMAIQAVYRIKFKPAERGGKAIDLKQRVKVSFQLL